MATSAISPVRDVHDTLIKNREDALALVRRKGLVQTQRLLVDSKLDLEKRLAQTIKTGAGDGSFTAVQIRATLAQVKAVLKQITVPGLRSIILASGTAAAQQAAGHTIKYLRDADQAFRGVGTQPLALREASMLDASVSGVHASILRRLATSGEAGIEGAEAVAHAGKLGILQRYGMNTVQHFEETLQKGLITKKPWAQMRTDITKDSPFLQQAPAHWAARIVRTEVHSAYNRAGWEATREADEELQDMVKILAAVFDNRTAADSYAVHGQIRLPEEAFESWFGLYQHPPNRPNDREIVVPHRIAWPLPDYLRARGAHEIAAAWKREGRKGAPPPQPQVSTVDLDRFGNEEPPKGNVAGDNDRKALGESVDRPEKG